MKKLIDILLCTSAFAAAFASAAPVPTTLTSIIRADNSYTIYVSTDNNSAGSSFGTLENWNAVSTNTTLLISGQDYYLHIYAHDTGGVAGMLGQFSLTGTDFKFANGTQSLLTNTTDWRVNATGFTAPYGTPTAATTADINAYWGSSAGINSSAQWIWAGNNHDINDAYFTTTITYNAPSTTVPEPGSLALLSLGLAGVVMIAARRRVRPDGLR